MKNLLTLAFISIISISTASAHLCAVVYQGINQTGARMYVPSFTKIRDLSDYSMNGYYGQTWNNKISSVTVKDGCKLVLFQYENWGRHYDTGERIGTKRVYKANRYYRSSLNIDAIDWAMNNKASSLKCVCAK